MEPTQPSVAPYWNIISVVLPVAATAVACMILLGSRSSGGYAGAIGQLLLAVIGVGGICLMGEAAAIAALVRGERMQWLSVAGILANMAVLLPALYLASRMD